MTAEKLQQALSWWQARTRSEQILLGATVAIALTMGLQRSVIDPLNKYQSGLTKQLDAQHAELRQVREKLASVGPLQIQQLQDEIRARLTKLRDDLSQAKEATAELRAGLVPAGEMAEVLGGLLRTHRGVKLAEILNLPAVAMSSPAAAAEPVAAQDKPQVATDGAAAATAKNAESPQNAESREDTESTQERAKTGLVLYKHPMRIILRGRYFEIAKYLAAVEDLPWRVYVDGLVLEVKAYPVVEATIDLHTLSEDEGWFFTS